MRGRLTLSLLLAAGCGAGAVSTTPSPSTAPMSSPLGAVTAEELRRDLFAFADDSMAGRETGTEGAARASRFLTARLRALGLESGGDSAYLQAVPMTRERLGAGTRVVVEQNGATRDVSIGGEVLPLLNLGEGAPPTKRSAEGEIVFVGYGLTTASPRRDDFAGLTLQGKVVVVVNGAPAGSDSATRERLEAQTAISERIGKILPQRPAAIVIMLTGKKGTELFEQAGPSLIRSITLRSNAPEVPEDDRQLPLIMFGSPVTGSPLLPAAWPTDDKAQVLTGRRMRARFEQERSPIVGYNVVAIVRGSDPVLNRTYVAFGAHYDHVGTTAAVGGDTIANGADDDGSGSVSLLAIARVLQQASVKPRRSTLLVWHVGEEKGLLGSKWFTEHSTVPIDSVVAQINADMIGRNAATQLYIVGPSAAPNRQSQRLGAIVDSVNATLPTPFAFNREWDSATHPEQIYNRSDHYSYARKGIPIVFFTSGLHDDYHRPDDEPQKIDYAKLAAVTRLMMEVGRAVADSPLRPR